MSVKIMGLIWDTDLDREQKFVLLAYADHADHDGENIFPAVTTIAKKTGYSRRSVQRITRLLEDNGYLIKDGKGIKGTNKYKIPLLGDKIAPLTKCQGDKNDTQLGDTHDTQTFNHQLKTIEEEEGPNIFQLYTQNIGTIPPLLVDDLKDAEQRFPWNWIESAFEIAIKRNARNWSYIYKILCRWETEGYQAPFKGKTNGRTYKPPQNKEAVIAAFLAGED